jgi:hypothetical protein
MSCDARHTTFGHPTVTMVLRWQRSTWRDSLSRRYWRGVDHGMHGTHQCMPSPPHNQLAMSLTLTRAVRERPRTQRHSSCRLLPPRTCRVASSTTVVFETFH